MKKGRRPSSYSEEDLECSVLPGISAYNQLFSFESNLKYCEHRMALIRTAATCLNLIGTILVLLKVFKVI